MVAFLQNLSLELNSKWHPAALLCMFTPFIFREQALGQVRLNVYDLVLELFPLVGDTTISLPERRAVGILSATMSSIHVC